MGSAPSKFIATQVLVLHDVLCMLVNQDLSYNYITMDEVVPTIASYTTKCPYVAIATYSLRPIGKMDAPLCINERH